MNENLLEAVMLMVVGMATVFVILLIVINLGKLLIFLVNKFAPEEVKVKNSPAAAPTPAAPIDASTMEVLKEAVRQVTGGKGYLKSARKA